MTLLYEQLKDDNPRASHSGTSILSSFTLFPSRSLYHSSLPGAEPFLCFLPSIISACWSLLM